MKKGLVITPDDCIHIHPLPDDYDSLLDELHSIAQSPLVEARVSQFLDSPYVIACPAFSETQDVIPSLPYNLAATRFFISDYDYSYNECIHGNVSIVWLDDREGCCTLAGLTDEEAEILCRDLCEIHPHLEWVH